MVVIKDIESTWSELSRALDEAEMVVFPTVPKVAARVDWPDEDWRRFLSVAQQAASIIVYCQRLHIDAEEIAHFQDEMFGTRHLRPPVGIRPHQEELSADELAVVEKLGRHKGEPFEITFGFVNGGVLHLWTAESPWWGEIFSEALRVREQQDHDAGVGYDQEDRKAKELDAKAKEEKWALRVAEDPRFLASPSRSARRVVVFEAVPELKGSADGPGSWAGRNVANGVVREAEALVESEVKPRLTRQALDNLAELTAEVAQDPEWEMARTKDARSTIVKRFLKAKYGFVMPTVVDQLASRKS
jgi:hypothetical protein